MTKKIKPKKTEQIAEGKNTQPEKRERLLNAAMAEFARYSFNDASTDRITAESKVSKGLLFHYFGSKKALYLACLDAAMNRLTAEEPSDKTACGEGTELFYSILFGMMDSKFSLCLSLPMETQLVNMASREGARELEPEKTELFGRYAAGIRAHSAVVIKRAVAALSLGSKEQSKTTEALLLYANALIGRYLVAYQTQPEKFFADAEKIKLELKEYLDMMLYGILNK